MKPEDIIACAIELTIFAGLMRLTYKKACKDAQKAVRDELNLLWKELRSAVAGRAPTQPSVADVPVYSSPEEIAAAAEAHYAKYLGGGPR